MFSTPDKVVLVTGAANGIGADIVREYVKEKSKFVAILDIHEDNGKKLENEIALEHGEGKVRFFKCDITNTIEMYDIFDKIFKEHGVIDIVVNNAGIASETPELYLKEIEINFTAVVTSSFKALELMRADHGGKGGTIINISSIVALSKNIGILHVYAATKSAVLCFSNRLGMDNYFSQTKVRVLTVCFGTTDTNILNTCKGFDEIANKEIDNLLNYLKSTSIQTSKVAAKGLIEAYKKGESGSTWLISKSRFLDITDKLKQAHEILFSLNLI